MAKVRSGGLTASSATLAVFARSSATFADAHAQLSSWPGAHWERNCAHKHIPALVQKGELRLVARGHVASQDRYEITPKGEKRCRALLHSHAAGPAAIERDKALAKIALCKTVEDIADAIDSLRAEEELFDRALEETHKRSMKAAQMRLDEPESAEDLWARLGDVSRALESRIWKDISTQIQYAREQLETLLEEFRES